MLGNFHRKLVSKRIVLLLAGVCGHVALAFSRHNFQTVIGVDNIFPTVANAVEEAKLRLKGHGDSLKIPELEQTPVTLVELFRKGGFTRLRREVPNPFKRKTQNPSRHRRRLQETQSQGEAFEMSV